MSDQLESALVIALRDTIKWDSAVNGTLPSISPDDPLDPLAYQTRDRVLAFRDLLVGAAVIQASVQVSDVYNYAVDDKPLLQGPVALTGSGTNTFSFYGSLAGNVNSQVRHVDNTSIPYDAARYADADLYGRDALVYEIISRACQEAFVDSPVPSLGTTVPPVPSTSVWSLAEGADTGASVNAALPVNVNLFKKPDQDLADRDNLLAAYASRLAQVLKNPFEHALRLLVQTTINGQVQREPEVYALVSDVTQMNDTRVWQSEPSLANTNKITYNVTNKTLQWVRENSDEVHVPQIYGLVIPGIDPDQLVQTVPEVPTLQDAQFWRSKAALIVPNNDYKQDEAWLETTATTATEGIYPQINCVSLPVPTVVSFNIPALPVGTALINALVKPCPKVYLAGQSTTTPGVAAPNGGALFKVNVASGSIIANTYIVVGGDGIVYNGNTYLPGMTFIGLVGVATYTQAGTLTSTVRVYSVSYEFALPPGPWALDFDYSDVTGTANGLGVRVQYTPTGGIPRDICSDVTPLMTDGVSISTSSQNLFDVVDPSQFTLTFIWTYGAGQLEIHKLTLTSPQTSGRFELHGAYQNSACTASFTGQAYQAEVVRFPVTVGTSGPTNFYVSADTYADIPLQILQVDAQSTGTNLPNPMSTAFPAWRQECLERAERVVQQGYAHALASYSAVDNVPTFRDSGSYWSPVASERWMAFTETCNPRLREVPDVAEIMVGRQYQAKVTPTVYNGTSYLAGDKFYGQPGIVSFTGQADQVGAFTKARPGHVGYPCLVPYGLYVEQSGTYGVKSYYDTPVSIPQLVTCQPWMVEYGLYVAQSDFWMPDTLTSARTEGGVVPQTAPSPSEYWGLFRFNSIASGQTVQVICELDGTAAYVDWGDGLIDTLIDGSTTHTYAVNGSRAIYLTGESGGVISLNVQALNEDATYYGADQVEVTADALGGLEIDSWPTSADINCPNLYDFRIGPICYGTTGSADFVTALSGSITSGLNLAIYGGLDGTLDLTTWNAGACTLGNISGTNATIPSVIVYSPLFSASNYNINSITIQPAWYGLTSFYIHSCSVGTITGLTGQPLDFFTLNGVTTLTEIDLSNSFIQHFNVQSVNYVTQINLDNAPVVTVVNAAFTALTTVSCSNASYAIMAALLAACAASAVNNGTFTATGNGTPNPGTDADNVTTLVGRGWTVTTD